LKLLLAAQPRQRPATGANGSPVAASDFLKGVNYEYDRYLEKWTCHRNGRCRWPAGRDVARILAVRRLLVTDREDMVVKAMSWALRELVVRDPEAVAGFLTEYEAELPARVKREVRNKMTTGLKNPKQKTG
jgi:hypothetical protein